MKRKHRLEMLASTRELEKEYDLFYLQLMKTLYKFKRFADMEQGVKDYVITKRILKKRVKEYDNPNSDSADDGAEFPHDISPLRTDDL